ncbi:MAG: L-aspartate oxidase, partial [Planctomycetota bacterium]|nr:L-aspartate oxidase [Planctomycetota bacterium]
PAPHRAPPNPHPMNEVFDQRRYLIPFRGSLLPQIFTDTLVIGAGVAGLRAAIAAAEHGEVIVLAKTGPSDSATAWAQGGIAGVLDDADSPESHIADTLAAGADLCDEPAARLVVSRSRERIDELRQWGARFDLAPDGAIALAREGGHAVPRIAHAGGDATGREISRCLFERARAAQPIRIFENCFALDLLTPTESVGAPCMGAITHHPRYGLQVIWARATILASGGAGALWRETSNPSVITGDGLAIAFRAGASVADMAFVQFHPTTLYVAGASRALVSEAVRGHGAHLVDRSGYRFMRDEHDLAELAPRDVVSRAIIRQLARSGDTHVFLDARHLSDFPQRFPGITKLLRKFEIDPASDLIPVHPAAHYTIGGVRTDLSARTDVPGLYAVGECSSTGLHGANRLASNSLLEGLVMGEEAGRTAVEMKSADNGWKFNPRPAPVQIISDIPLSDHGELDLDDVRSSVRSVMWRNVGVERAGGKLDDVVDMFDFWGRYTLDKIFDHPEGWETQNMLLVGALVARSALWRAESRGCHARSDAPLALDAFRVHDLWRRADPKPNTLPVADAPSNPAPHAPRAPRQPVSTP